MRDTASYPAAMRSTATALVTLLLATPAWGLPSHIEQNLRELLGFTDREIERLEKEAVVRSVESEETARTLTVAAAVRIGSPYAPILSALQDTRGVIESDALQRAGLFGNPASPEDLADFSLPPADLKTLPKCEIGRCKVKVAEATLKEFASLDWSAPDAEAKANGVARRRLAEYARGYQAKGSAALATFADKAEPLTVADGVQRLLAKATYIARHLPELVRHLRGYPSDRLPGAEDVLFWTQRDYGLTPVSGVTHAVVYAPGTGEGLEGLAVAIHLLSTHYLQARMQVVALFRDDRSPEVSWLVLVDRLRFDADLGGLQRGMLRRGVLKDLGERAEAFRRQNERR